MFVRLFVVKISLPFSFFETQHDVNKYGCFGSLVLLFFLVKQARKQANKNISLATMCQMPDNCLELQD